MKQLPWWPWIRGSAIREGQENSNNRSYEKAIPQLVDTSHFLLKGYILDIWHEGRAAWGLEIHCILVGRYKRPLLQSVNDKYDSSDHLHRQVTRSTNTPPTNGPIKEPTVKTVYFNPMKSPLFRRWTRLQTIISIMTLTPPNPIPRATATMVGQRQPNTLANCPYRGRTAVLVKKKALTNHTYTLPASRLCDIVGRALDVAVASTWIA